MGYGCEVCGVEIDGDRNCGNRGVGYGRGSKGRFRNTLTGFVRYWAHHGDRRQSAMPITRRPLPRAAVSRAWLDVPYSDRHLVKKLGALWDPASRRRYAPDAADRGAGRSEEHTSELQSPDHLV